MVETLLKMSEVAERLKVSVKTVRRFVDQGALARIVTGGGTIRKTFAFFAADVEAFIRSRGAVASSGSTIFASPERLATLKKKGPR